jgi:KUP system potassium uptake protein
MIATIIIVAVFNNATQLTNAYGFAVATVMFTTSVLIALQIRYVKQLPYVLAIAYFLFFGFLDGKTINHLTLSPDAEIFQAFSGVRH